jgi:UDP-N-acetylmuramyl pentapeptide phosphotransferase/UDP-N-acetylglucosamine-1-phosphate transferase|tara:strand:- start:1278 stop:2300 length:1023 start_codon:yes stop_codon:yes gene_type:complete
MIFLYLLTLTIIFLFINKLLIQKKILISETGDLHQKFASKSSVPLTGGLFIFLGYFYFINEKIFSFMIFSFIIFILGIFSDLKLIKSAKKKLLLQIFLILSYTVFNDVQINDTRLTFLDNILHNNYINYLFVTFCILIIVNGSNFIDGMNTLCVGYYLLITFIIFYLQLNEIIALKYISIFYILILLLFVFLLNIINQLYLGDSGSYLLGFSFSIFLISIYNWNQYISPFFVVLLLWYPSYENLFSITRKNIIKRSPMYPDAKHLHQLIFFYIIKKLNRNIFLANILTAQIINFYNLIIFFIGLNFIHNSIIQILLILFSIGVYTLFYLKFFKFKYQKSV